MRRRLQLAALVLGAVALGYGLGRWQHRAAAPTSTTVQPFAWPRHLEETAIAFPELPPEDLAAAARDFKRPDLVAPPENLTRHGVSGNRERPRVLGRVRLNFDAPVQQIDALVVLESSGEVTVEATAVRGWHLERHRRRLVYLDALTASLSGRLDTRLGLELPLARRGRVAIIRKFELYREALPERFGGYDEGIRGGVRVTWDI